MTLSEKLAQYGFHPKQPLQGRVGAYCRKCCTHGKTSNMLNLGVSAVDALHYGTHCAIPVEPRNRSLNSVLRLVRALIDIEKGLEDGNERRIAVADIEMPYGVLEQLLFHESELDLESATDKIIDEKLSTMIVSGTGKRYVAKTYLPSWDKAEVRISRHRWGFGGKKIRIIGQDDVAIRTVVDEIVHVDLFGVGSNEISPLGPDDTQEILETADALALTMTLEEALEAARNLE